MAFFPFCSLFDALVRFCFCAQCKHPKPVRQRNVTVEPPSGFRLLLAQRVIMRFVTWNVDGLRSAAKTNMLTALDVTWRTDVLCLQEVRTSPDVARLILRTHVPDLPHISVHVNPRKPGQSGVAVASRFPIVREIAFDAHDDDSNNDNAAIAFGGNEGRVLGVEISVPTPSFPSSSSRAPRQQRRTLRLLCVYVTNSGADDLRRLAHRTQVFDPALRDTVLWWRPDVLLGDLNVAAAEIDKWNGHENPKPSAGWTLEERRNLRELLLRTRLVDAFRKLHPDVPGWTYFPRRSGGRLAKQHGWRIDYALVAPALAQAVVACFTLAVGAASDHKPLALDLRDAADSGDPQKKKEKTARKKNAKTAEDALLLAPSRAAPPENGEQAEEDVPNPSASTAATKTPKQVWKESRSDADKRKRRDAFIRRAIESEGNFSPALHHAFLANRVKEALKDSKFGEAAYSRVQNQLPDVVHGPNALRDITGVGPKTKDVIDAVLNRTSLYIHGLEPTHVLLAHAIADLVRLPGVTTKRALELLRPENQQALRQNPLTVTGNRAATACVLRHIEDLECRIPRAEVTKHVELVERVCAELQPPSLRPPRVEAMGSYRRGSPDSGDVDFLVQIPPAVLAPWVASHDAKDKERERLLRDFSGTLLRALQNAGYLQCKLSSGVTRAFLVCKLPERGAKARRVDLFYSSAAEWPFAQLWLTGPGSAAAQLRTVARRQGLLLNERGLFDVETGAPVPVGTRLPANNAALRASTKSGNAEPHPPTEQDIFRRLGEPYTPPTQRS